MKRFTFFGIGLLLLAVASPQFCLARGFGGGGGGRIGGGGGGGRVGGGGGARPSMGHMGGGARPSVSRPSASRPAVSRPPVSRPSAPSHSIARPSGGMKPSVQRPQVGGGNFPSSRPSLPNAGGGSHLANRPGGSMPSLANRPSTGNRPQIGGGDFANRPGAGGRPDFGNMRPGGAGPSAGDLGNFLGIQQPLRPSTLPGQTRPGFGDLAGGPGGVTRPGAGGGGIERPGQLPSGGTGIRPGGGGSGTERPGLRPDGGGVRPGGGGSGERWPGGNRPDRPWNPGDRPNLGPNHGIHQRPNWAHIGDNTINNINVAWGNAIGNRGNGNWFNNHPDRWNHWNNWGDNVRDRWHDNNRWFDHDWWDNHWHPGAGWGYWNGFWNRPWGYWWTIPAWGALTSWCSWGSCEPYYYDYGTGGNVVYSDNSVYIDGQQVATADEFAQSAAVLATVPAPATEQQAAAAQWMALGTFAVSTGESDVNPSKIMQLAVDKQGIISGTMYNKDTDQTQTIQGKVDKQTQRVAFRIGTSDNCVCETGLYNLTQAQAPLLVHYGTERIENFLLVRLEAPADSGTSSSSQGQPF